MQVSGPPRRTPGSMAARASHVPATALRARWERAPEDLRAATSSAAPSRRRRGAPTAATSPVSRAGAPRSTSSRRPSPCATCAATPRRSPATACAATSLARAIASLRAFYRILREHGEVAQNPAELLTLPKRPRALPHVLRPEELASLLDRIAVTTPLDARDRAMFELAYAAGLRAEELVNLTLDSVDFDAEQVRVEGKGSKTRFVPVGEPALRALARLPRACAARARARRRARAAALEVRPAALDLRRAAAPARSGRRAPDWAARCTRTRCDTRLRPIFWTAAPICARSRSCSDIRPSRQRRFTLG